MDSDEFDGDDIADEDLIVAATQATTPTRAGSTFSLNIDRFQPSVRASASSASLDSSKSRQPHSMQKTNSSSTIRSSFVDLENLPLNVFSNSPANAQASHNPARHTTFQPGPRIGGPSASFRQTTLFGQTVQVDEDSGPVQSSRNRVFRADLPPEPPTHHELDHEALKTWIYPTNLGPTRDYQFSIVKNGLFNNTLVALPTGLGKTFIAATVMLNYFRWMKTAKLIFVAPTKPLVSQQVDACFHIAGIPRSQTTLLTGEVAPALRAEEWSSKRVFFMTPQTLENDLSAGFADPKSIGLLVIDEAHRATGNYSYVKVVTFLRRFSSSFRILALTATPGSKVEAVQEVIDGLGISHVEIRTENSLDIKPYVHQRDEDIVLLDPSDEIIFIKDLFSKALKPLVDKLSSQNIYYGRDPMALTTYGLVKARKDWFAGAGRNANQGVKFMMMAVFSILSSLAHTIKLLGFHGIKPFYDSLTQFRDEIEGKGQKASKFKRQIVEDASFQEMMTKMERWVRSDDFVGHPKLTHLSDTVLNHFMDAGEGREGSASSNTRIIVFSEYRDSAEEIVRVLNTHQPLIRAAVFVGQADSKRSEGMKQAEQIQRIQKFKEGEFNVLVATSIGEEGLDIGQVDLIICYDASASPIRMLQRMGRTGRKRAGRVVLLLMRGKEEDNYAKSKDGYEKMQLMICDGSRFNFRHDLSTRIVPRDVRPEVDMKAVEIPVENTQESGLPEPKKRRAQKKRPPKKFHMPDGVETGFQTVASMLGKGSSTKKSKAQKAPTEEDEVADIPALDQVLLRSKQTDELNKVYKNLPYQHRDAMEFIEQVDVTANPAAQRVRRKTVHVKHGAYTKRSVKLFQTLAKSQSATDRFAKPYGDVDNSRYDRLPFPLPGEGSDSEILPTEQEPPPKRRKVASHPENNKNAEDDDDDDDELEELSAAIARGQPRKATSRAKRTRHISQRADSDEDVEGIEEDLPPLRKRSAVAKSKLKQQPKKPAPKTAGTKRVRGKPKKASAAALYDESADEGDDCRRTSDLELTDDSDSGADLEGFVVGDNVATSSNFVTSSIRRRSTSPTSPVSVPSSSSTITSRATKPKQKTKLYYEPTSFNTTQDSEDDVPSMSQLVRDRGLGGRFSQKHSGIEDIDDDDEEDEPRQRGRDAQIRKRKVVVDDEESDE
ncbi:type III restriction enzyme [Xylariaceae sp. AK1471]|nr:type III restriction enzyme [Xylariaceae sp. AK1471]